MTKLTFSAAAIIAVAGVLASASAYADHNGGGPIVKGDQCFTYMKGSGHDARFGTWAACPQTASATRVTTVTRNGRKIQRTVPVQAGAGSPSQNRSGAAPSGGAVQFEQHQQGYWGN